MAPRGTLIPVMYKRYFLWQERCAYLGHLNGEVILDHLEVGPM